MPLSLGDEFSPDVGAVLGPSVGTLGEDVMRKDVVVAKVGHNGNGGIIGGIGIIDIVVLAKDLDEFVSEHLVQLDDLRLGAWDELVVIVTSRIASPDDKVDRVFEVVIDPLESSVDQAEWRVTVGLLSTEYSSITLAPVASIVAVCGGGLTVEWIWVIICRSA